MCLRKDIAAPFLVPKGLFDVVPALNLDFNEKPIMFGEVADFKGREAKSKTIRLLWDNRQKGDLNQGAANERLFGKGSNFNQTYVYLDRICPPLQAKNLA